MRKAHHRFAFIGSAYGMKLPARNLEIAGVEKRSDQIDPTGVTYQDYLVSQLLGEQMQMEGTAIGIDDKF